MMICPFFTPITVLKEDLSGSIHFPFLERVEPKA
jgi:hypothetical protein